MIATRQNHTVPMAPSLIGRRVGEIAATVSARLGPHFNLAINQKQPQNGQYRVHAQDRKSTRLNSSHGYISYAVFCLKKKKIIKDAESLRSADTGDGVVGVDERDCLDTIAMQQRLKNVLSKSTADASHETSISWVAAR